MKKFIYYFLLAVFNALADSRKNVVCEECSSMSANQKCAESDKDRDSDDYDNEFDNFAPPPQTQNNQHNNAQQQGKYFFVPDFIPGIWYYNKYNIKDTKNII